MDNFCADPYPKYLIGLVFFLNDPRCFERALSRFKKMQKCGQDRGLKTPRSRAWNLHREGIP